MPKTGDGQKAVADYLKSKPIDITEWAKPYGLLEDTILDFMFSQAEAANATPCEPALALNPHLLGSYAQYLTIDGTAEQLPTFLWDFGRARSFQEERNKT